MKPPNNKTCCLYPFFFSPRSEQGVKGRYLGLNKHMPFHFHFYNEQRIVFTLCKSNKPYFPSVILN